MMKDLSHQDYDDQFIGKEAALLILTRTMQCNDDY